MSFIKLAWNHPVLLRIILVLQVALSNFGMPTTYLPLNIRRRGMLQSCQNTCGPWKMQIRTLTSDGPYCTHREWTTITSIVYAPFATWNDWRLLQQIKIGRSTRNHSSPEDVCITATYISISVNIFQNLFIINLFVSWNTHCQCDRRPVTTSR